MSTCIKFVVAIYSVIIQIYFSNSVLQAIKILFAKIFEYYSFCLAYTYIYMCYQLRMYLNFTYRVNDGTGNVSSYSNSINYKCDESYEFLLNLKQICFWWYYDSFLEVDVSIFYFLTSGQC